MTPPSLCQICCHICQNVQSKMRRMRAVHAQSTTSQRLPIEWCFGTVMLSSTHFQSIGWIDSFLLCLCQSCHSANQPMQVRDPTLLQLVFEHASTVWTAQIIFLCHCSQSCSAIIWQCTSICSHKRFCKILQQPVWPLHTPQTRSCQSWFLFQSNKMLTAKTELTCATWNIVMHQWTHLTSIWSCALR